MIKINIVAANVTSSLPRWKPSRNAKFPRPPADQSRHLYTQQAQWM